MTVDSETINTSRQSTVACGACSTDNPTESRFCAGCGHALYENCAGCSKPVSFTQAFCGSCGENLKTSFEKRREVFAGRLDDAVEAAKKSEFDRALAILGRLRQESDFRFKELAENAQKAYERIAAVSDNVGSVVDQALERVKPFIEQRNHEAIIAALEDVPEKRLDQTTANALKTARHAVARREELFTACQAALRDRDWLSVGPLVSQLAELDPNEPQFHTLGTKVGAKLVARAAKSLEAGRYKGALECLESVPTLAQNEAFDATRNRVNDILWFREQLEHEPFDTPMLGRLAVALSKREPDNRTNQKAIQQIASNLRSGTRTPRGLFPIRKSTPICWLDCPFTHLATPTSLPGFEAAGIRGYEGRFNVAIGLALQGIGKAKIDQNLIEKKGLFNSLKRRKDSLAWGLDLGSTSIKAIALQATDEGIEIAHAFVHEFEGPLDATNSEVFSRQLCDTLQMLHEKHSLGDTPVWSNLPARHVIARFSVLPPVTDKQSKELIEREKETRIPVELDTMVVRHTLEPLQTATASGDIESGRTLLITAAKKAVVDLYAGSIVDAGLNLAGLQADPMALVNLIHFEFQSDLESGGDSDTKLAREIDPSAKHPAIAMIHSGAESTTVIWVAKDSHWFWTVENGAADLVGLITKQAKTTRTNAEHFLRNPHELPRPSADFASVESRLDELKARIQKVAKDNLEQVSRFEIKACYASGGNTFNHQWMRRMLLANHSSSHVS